MLFQVGQPKTSYIFHVARGKSSPLFFHPFGHRGTVLRILSKGKVRGLFGTDPNLRAVNRFRNELYDHINVAVRQWISDVRFVPRFLYSAASFLIIYLALTLTSHIRLPISVSLAISLVCGLTAYAAVSRRDMHSQLALRKRIALRAQIDLIRFQESEFVRAVEEQLALIETGERAPDRRVFRELTGLFPAESAQFRRYLNERILQARRNRTDPGRQQRTRGEPGFLRGWRIPGFTHMTSRVARKPSWAEVHLKAAGLVGAEDTSLDQFLIDIASGEPVTSRRDAKQKRSGGRVASIDEALSILCGEFDRALSDSN
ncbi:MAG TPA: hypothetical protein VMW87_09165 [Spirochaetia bacterium]|nr:hypothetical protein [Spirochaetia bacterium]